MSFSTDEISALIRVASDIRFADQILDGTQVVTVDRKGEDGADSGKHLMNAAENSVHAVSEILKESNEALADNRLGHQEQLRIRSEFDQAEREFATLRMLLEVRYRRLKISSLL